MAVKDTTATTPPAGGGTKRTAPAGAAKPPPAAAVTAESSGCTGTQEPAPVDSAGDAVSGPYSQARGHTPRRTGLAPWSA